MNQSDESAQSINYTRKIAQNIFPADLFISATSEFPVNTNNYYRRQPSPSSKIVLLSSRSLYLLCVSERHISAHPADTMGYDGHNLKITIYKGLVVLHRIFQTKEHF